ncbi:hypothetical protein IQ06DRAFT_146253 [Phaeosphaeriaceae sp. SRC1lsM3a]|nr:hypothetical protein IQ06DRAFT_146253 [Stagonospora sp. SRC1lsM3a]
MDHRARYPSIMLEIQFKAPSSLSTLLYMLRIPPRYLLPSQQLPHTPSTKSVEMAKILAPFVALMSLLVTISAKPGGGDPAYSCRGHEGERECVGKRKEWMSGSPAVRVCRDGMWRHTLCDDGCYLLPTPRCRLQPKCWHTEPNAGGGCVPIEDYDSGESDHSDVD